MLAAVLFSLDCRSPTSARPNLRWEEKVTKFFDGEHEVPSPGDSFRLRGKNVE